MSFIKSIPGVAHAIGDPVDEAGPGGDRGVDARHAINPALGTSGCYPHLRLESNFLEKTPPEFFAEIEE
jgi:hypothetical protein